MWHYILVQISVKQYFGHAMLYKIDGKKERSDWIACRKAVPVDELAKYAAGANPAELRETPLMQCMPRDGIQSGLGCTALASV